MCVMCMYAGGGLGWQEMHDPESGSSYYYNVATGDTSWEGPKAPAVDQATAQLSTTAKTASAVVLPPGALSMNALV